MDSAEDHYDNHVSNQWKENNASLAGNWMHHWPTLATLFYNNDKGSNIMGRFNIEYIGIDNIEIPHQERPNYILTTVINYEKALLVVAYKIQKKNHNWNTSGEKIMFLLPCVSRMLNQWRPTTASVVQAKYRKLAWTHHPLCHVQLGNFHSWNC